MGTWTIRRNGRGMIVAALALSAGGGILANAASAAPVYGTPALSAGVRSVSVPGLQTTEPDWLDAQVAWSITPNANGTLTYLYTFTNFNAPAISHLTLDLSDDAVSGGRLADPAAVTGFRVNGAPAPRLEFGDIDGITGAVKFDASDPETTPNLVTYSFVSNREPVWGHIYVKAGSSSELKNSGFGDQLVSANVLDYVARPNGAVPEPAALGVLAGIAVVACRRQRRARGD